MPIVFPAVKALIVKEDKFLIIKQVVGDKIFWDLPGGRVNHGENPYQALHREIKEETSLEIDITKPVGMWWFFRTDNHQVVCNTFSCTPKHDNIDLTKNVADETIEEYRWVSREEFLQADYPVSHQSLKDLVTKSIK